MPSCASIMANLSSSRPKHLRKISLGVRRYSSLSIRTYLKVVHQTPLSVLTLGLRRYVIKGILQSTASSMPLTEWIRAMFLLALEGLMPSWTGLGLELDGP
jgi:hypothetical protein